MQLILFILFFSFSSLLYADQKIIDPCKEGDLIFDSIVDDKTCQFNLKLDENVVVERIKIVQYAGSENYVLRLIRSEGVYINRKNNYKNSLNSEEFGTLLKIINSRINPNYKIDRVFLDLGFVDSLYNTLKNRINFQNHSEVSTHMNFLINDIKKSLLDNFDIISVANSILNIPKNDIKLGMNSPSFKSEMYGRKWSDMKKEEKFGMDVKKTWISIGRK